MKYLDIVKRYEKCLEKHGDSHLGVEWGTKEGAEKRYEVMLDMIEGGSILDFGCGTSGLLDYCPDLKEQYTGLDISEKFIAVSREKYPDINYICQDVLSQGLTQKFDYVIMNGILTAKDKMSFSDMWTYMESILAECFSYCRKGLAFNVMSTAVDWQEDYIFHVPIGQLVDYIVQLTRKYTIRHDYGLYEYTVYLHK